MNMSSFHVAEFIRAKFSETWVFCKYISLKTMIMLERP